jgi:hypothetical protein
LEKLPQLSNAKTRPESPIRVRETPSAFHSGAREQLVALARPTIVDSKSEIVLAFSINAAPFAPQKAIWLEDKLPWVVIDESLPSFPKTPKSG